jgi:hypothetical protein
MARARSAKFEIDKNRKAKAAEKRQRRQNKADEVASAPDATGAEPVDASSVMEQLSALHTRFADGGMEFDDFEEQKADLLARLPVD